MKSIFIVSDDDSSALAAYTERESAETHADRDPKRFIIHCVPVNPSNFGRGDVATESPTEPEPVTAGT